MPSLLIGSDDNERDNVPLLDPMEHGNPLSSLIPDEAQFSTLPLEDVAGTLLMHLNNLPDNRTVVAQHGKINQHNFLHSSFRRLPYPDVSRRILLEAWGWLESEGLLVRETDTVGASFFITRRGRAIKSWVDFSAFRRGHLLPQHQVHSAIAAKVYPTFLRGDYDTAIFQAFREVEVAVRFAGNLPQSLVGEKLMRTAFASGIGPLRDTQLPPGEQEAMAHLLPVRLVFTAIRLLTATFRRTRSKRPKSLCSPVSFCELLTGSFLHLSSPDTRDNNCFYIWLPPRRTWHSI